jgi:hypothetical protein
MSNKGIRIYTNEWSAEEYAEAVENGDTPEDNSGNGILYLISDYAEDFGEWNDDETQWINASDVVTAYHLLSGSSASFWAESCSSSPAEIGPNDWYEEDYTHLYSGDVTRKSAHLVGEWTFKEAREIHALVFPKR